jgi:hypothetical protein
LPELETWLVDHASDLRAATSADDVFWLGIAARGIEAWENSSFYTASDAKLSYESRDLANAETILDISERLYPDRKTVLWAHNAHLVRNSTALTGGLGLGGATMTGTRLAEQIGPDYVAIGLVGYDIDLTWFTPYDAPPAQGRRAVEHLLHTLGEDYLLVNLSPEGETSFPPGEVFDLGHPVQGIEAMVPGEQFDALMFADESPGMTPAWD